MCIADDTKWLFFRIVPPPSAGNNTQPNWDILYNSDVCYIAENVDVFVKELLVYERFIETSTFWQKSAKKLNMVF